MGRHVFLKEYKIEFSKDGIHWRTVAKQRRKSSFKGDKNINKQTDLIFKGNENNEKIQYNFLPRITIARYIRIRPVKWHSRIAVRLELFGCSYDERMSLPLGDNVLFN